MLSTVDLERLIAEKRREIEMEKSALGLSPPPAETAHIQVQDLEANEDDTPKSRKKVTLYVPKEHADHADTANFEKRKEERQKTDAETIEEIPPELERYIRRYLGLPVMLKAGEFSPNNPILREERTSGDALLGLGEYERRRNTLRKIRQQQYREYLDQQAKKKQEEKERKEKLYRELEEKERQREEERERLRRELQEDKPSLEQRRASVCFVSNVDKAPSVPRSKVETAVQVGLTKPLSVAVQTEDNKFYGLPPYHAALTTAERELSPRCADPERYGDDRRAAWDQQRDHWGDHNRNVHGHDDYTDSPPLRSAVRSKQGDLRHSYMPSILDSDAIRLRNLQAEKEAAERRQSYQQELKRQIEEQQRIREERKNREKMLEQAEMRRLEEQLRMLRMSAERERGRQDFGLMVQDSAKQYEKKRNSLQRDIDYEQKKLRTRAPPDRRLPTSRSENSISQLPFYYPTDESTRKKPPYSTNIPDDSIFSPSYDVDSYLRKNLNPSKQALFSSRLDTIASEANSRYSYDVNDGDNDVISNAVHKKDDALQRLQTNGFGKVVTETAEVHEPPKERNVPEKPLYEPSFLRKPLEVTESRDDTPIPVLKHSPSVQNVELSEDLSDKMRLVDDKWKVPAVQKNILKTLPNEEGKSVSILTQLGSIRRQLQLEQMRLDSLKGTGK